MHENFVDEHARVIGIRVNRNTYLMGIIQLGRWAMLTIPFKFFLNTFSLFFLAHSVHFFVVFSISKDK